MVLEQENSPAFEPGQIVLTRAVYDLIDDDREFCRFVLDSFKRYLTCDWGDISGSDKAACDAAVKNGEDRIFAAYKDPKSNQRIWIITEWDRSATTILFPSDY